MNELTISLDPHRKTPLYEQIYGFIREEIRGGRIRAGERLPSARALSGYLSVSRSTVDLAYEQLVSEGYLESVPCKGYFVCEIEGLYRLDEKKEETKEDDAAEQMPFSYDFAVTGTAPGGFPQNSWKKISKEVLLDADDSLFQLGDAKGEHGLREAIRDYLHHARGVNCRTEQIIVGAGNDYLQCRDRAALVAEFTVVIILNQIPPIFPRCPRKELHPPLHRHDHAHRELVRRHDVRQIRPAFFQLRRPHARFVHRNRTHRIAKLRKTAVGTDVGRIFHRHFMATP